MYSGDIFLAVTKIVVRPELITILTEMVKWSCLKSSIPKSLSHKKKARSEVTFICICLDMFLGGIVNNPTLVMDNDKMSIFTLMDLPAPLNAVACEELLA